MRNPEVLIVGGGISGISLARDLAMRDVDVLVAERGTLTGNTSGRSHGLLHSGARYATSDPVTARHCYSENRILREIASGCIRQTGGYFVALPEDGVDYRRRKRRACRALNIPFTSVSTGDLQSRTPWLTDDVTDTYRVPDAVVSPSRLVAATAAAAERHGALIRTDSPVTDIRVAERRIPAVVVSGERIRPDHVINAAGPWSGRVADLAGVPLPMSLTRGVMVAFPRSEAPVDVVINRCGPPGDGDILVPRSDRLVAGTTSVPVEGPTALDGSHWESRRVHREIARVIPSLEGIPPIGRYWGIRPIPASTAARGGRGYRCVDHDIGGMTSIAGGKLTTARLMAERVADHVCEQLGVTGSSRTADRSLPAQDDPDRLNALVERYGGPGPADIHGTAQ